MNSDVIEIKKTLLVKLAFSQLLTAFRFRRWKARNSGRWSHDVAELDDVKLYYEVYGSGEPLLLLHGGVADHESWAPQIPALAEHFKVIAPDTRAHGRSEDNPSVPLSYYLFAEDMVRLLDHLEIDRTHVVGWSDGGCTSLVLGMKHGERVNRIVPGGTPYNITNYYPGVLDRFIITDKQAESNSYALVRKKYQRVAPDPQHWTSFLKRLVGDMFRREPDFTLDSIAAIQARALVVIGSNEQFYPVQHAEELANAIPNADLVVIPDATHFAPWEKPEFFNQSVLGFLRD